MKLLSLPEELVIEIVAKLGESSLADLARLKICSRNMKAIAESTEVYKRAFIADHMILTFINFPSWLKEGELAFLMRCFQSGNPFKEYIDAVNRFIFKNDIEGALLCLECAIGSSSVSAPAAYLKCLCLLFSPNDDKVFEGVRFLSTLKLKGFFKYELERCRASFCNFVDIACCRLQIHPTWLNYVEKPCICPNREEHRAARIKDKWSLEGSDDCLACDADREREYVYSWI